MLAALLFLLTPAADAESVTLRHAFAAGDSVLVRIDNDAALDLRSPEGEQQITHSSSTVRRAEVERVKPDGSGVVVLTIERTRMAADAPDTDRVVYDSRVGGEVPEMFEGVAGAIGKPLLRMVVTPLGEVTKVEELQGGANAAATAETAESVLRSNMQPYIPLPEGAVAVGEKWKDTYKVNARDESGFPIPVKLQRTFTLKSLEGGVATVAWRTVVLTPITDPKVESQVMRREVAGTLTFDADAGRMTSREAVGNRTVVGFAGAGTSMRSVTKRTEALVENDRVAEDAEPDAARR